MIHHRDLRVIAGDDERVREHDAVRAGDPVEDFDGLRDDDILRHQDYGAGAHMGEMQRGEFLGAKLRLALHEVLLQDIALRAQCFVEGQADDALRQARVVVDHETVVDEDELGGVFRESRRTRERFLFVGLIGFGGDLKGFQGQLLRAGVAPVLVAGCPAAAAIEIHPRPRRSAAGTRRERRSGDWAAA